MRRALRLFVVVCVVLFSLSSVGYAGSKNPMYDFYDGLADVMEQNMNSPDSCVVEAEGFIKSNIGPIKEAMLRSKQMAQSGQYDNMTEQDFKKMEQSITPEQQREMEKGMEALNRYMTALQSFSIKHPEHAEKILKAMESAIPQDMQNY